MTTELRRALRLLEDRGELRIYDDPVSEYLEAASLYASSAGVPAPRPTTIGPAVLFRNVTPSGGALVMGVFGSRDRCAALIGSTAEALSASIRSGIDDAIPPTAAMPARRKSVGADLRRIPIPTTTRDDAGPYITMGLIVARDATTGRRNASVHRLCVQSVDELTIWIVPGRDLDLLRQAARERGEALEVAIHIGLDPAIYLASCVTGRLAPPGTDELAIAGGIRGSAVRMCRAETVDLDVIAGAEWIIEGRLDDRETSENARDPRGASLPEFLGYQGSAHPALPIITVSAITCTDEPIAQSVLGPGQEQSNLLGFGMELQVIDAFVRAGVTTIDAVIASAAGGGQLLVFARCRAGSVSEDAEVRTAAVRVLRELRMLKYLILVSEDTDLFDHEELWWAFTTRTQADRDIVTLQDLPGFPLDPTQDPEYSATLSAPGRSAKSVIDCRSDPRRPDRFRRPQFGGAGTGR